MLKENLINVENNITKACEKAGRNRSEVTLIAVSKTKPIEDIRTAMELGQHAFGENYEDVLNYLESVNSLVDFEYLSGNRGTLNEKGEYLKYVNPEYVKKAEELKKIAAEFRNVAKSRRYGRHRAQNVSYNIIAEHNVFVELVCDIVIEAAKGNTEGAKEKFDIWNRAFSEKEVYIEANYDHYSANKVIKRLIG